MNILLGDSRPKYARKTFLKQQFLSRLSPYTDGITGDSQCGFQCNRINTDQVSCIHQIMEKNRSTMRK
jgi:hypothetical protein